MFIDVKLFSLLSLFQVLSPEEMEEVYQRGLRQAEAAAANAFHCRTPDCKGFCFYEDEV